MYFQFQPFTLFPNEQQQQRAFPEEGTAVGARLRSGYSSVSWYICTNILSGKTQKRSGRSLNFQVYAISVKKYFFSIDCFLSWPLSHPQLLSLSIYLKNILSCIDSFLSRARSLASPTMGLYLQISRCDSLGLLIPDSNHASLPYSAIFEFLLLSVPILAFIIIFCYQYLYPSIFTLRCLQGGDEQSVGAKSPTWGEEILLQCE